MAQLLAVAMSASRTLGLKRAESIKRWLEENGVAPSRLTAESAGFDRPLDTNRTAEGQRRNDRVELRIRTPAP